MADRDALNELMNSVLDDFRPRSIQTSSGSSSSAAPTRGHGLGVGLPALPSKDKKAAKGKLKNLKDLDEHELDEIESRHRFDNASTDNLVESFVKQLGDLGNPREFLDTMMKQLVSKHVLHKPMKLFCERYPQWLKTNKDSISREDLDRYSKQYEYAKQLCNLYENKPDDFETIVDIMHNMQTCGQPPKDLLHQFAKDQFHNEDDAPVLPDLLKGFDQGAGMCSIM